MRNDLTTEQLQQPVTVTLPLGVVLDLAETTRLMPSEAIVGQVHTFGSFNTPAIGDAYEGGIYAGLTLLDNRVKALVLLPGDEELKWKDAIAWAENQGCVLPSRIDQLVLFQNLKDQFKEQAYWSGEQHAADSGYAWYQNFDTGYQSLSNVYSELRARAVRRLEIK